MMGLSQRQLIWVAAAVVLLLAVSQWLVRPIIRYKRAMTLGIQQSEKRLQNLNRLARTYSDMRAESTRHEQALRKRQRDFTLFAFLEGLASRDGLRSKIEFMRPSVKQLSDVHQEEQVEMRLKDVSLSSLVPYLYHVETAPERVRIKRITIRPRKRDPSLLEVNLVIVTQGLRKAGSVSGSKSARSKIQTEVEG